MCIYKGHKYICIHIYIYTDIRYTCVNIHRQIQKSQRAGAIGYTYVYMKDIYIGYTHKIYMCKYI